MEFIFKKTEKLSPIEKSEICALFFEVYKKDKPLEKFEKQFGQSVLNNSYHGLMKQNDEIVGMYAAIPFEYNYFGQRYIFALSVDTMISQKYRGVLSSLKKIAHLVYEALKKDGIPFIFGFPNENFYLVKKKVLGWQDIGQLDYYVLPIRIGALKNKLRVFDIATMSFASVITQISKVVGHDSQEKERPIAKINDDRFVAYRYDGSYKIVRAGDGSFFVYKIDREEGVRTAYLMDVYPMNEKAVVESINYIFKKEGDKIDMIGYLGKMESRPINLLKTPKYLEPKAVRMSGKILNDDIIDDRVFDINNWNVNLSNFDVR